MKDNSFDTELDLLTDVALDVSESADSLTVLIKHDYYSSDNDNGRSLLDSFLDGLILASDRIHMIIITDSAVKLFNTSVKLQTLISSVNSVLVCSESLNYYDVNISQEYSSKLNIIPMADITDCIIESKPSLILE